MCPSVHVSDHGDGFKWTIEELVIDTNDVVTWSWEAPPHVLSATYGVYQTENLHELQDGSGFGSGPQTSKGKPNKH